MYAMDELALRRLQKRTRGRVGRSPGLRDLFQPIFHPDQHIIPALRCLDAACLSAMKDPKRARRLAWQAIQHAEICDMPNVRRAAKALLGAL